MLQSPRRTKVHFKHLVNMHSLELSNNPYVEYTILISLFTTSRYLTKLLPRPSLCPFRASLRSNRPLPFHHLVHNLPPPTILSTTCRCTPTYHHACCILISLLNTLFRVFEHTFAVFWVIRVKGLVASAAKVARLWRKLTIRKDCL